MAKGLQQTNLIKEEDLISEVAGVVSVEIRKSNDGLKWQRDPFNKYASPSQVGIDGLNIEGIIWDEKTPSVLINGAILFLGERIGKYELISIQQDKIIFSDGINEFEINLK